MHSRALTVLLTLALVSPPIAQAQFGRQGPQFASPEVGEDRTITFRVLAPEAEAVRLSAGDIPDVGEGALTQGEEGVWEITVGPAPAGAYRYHFNIDGVATIDPKNPATSESNSNAWSLVVVDGSPRFDVRDVPHGSVAEVTYASNTLGRSRRMHVYTPPGYETGDDDYPVFYLLHGASDCDDSWTSVGRAGYILDNLIADGEAVPMIVVMPAGHTGSFSFGGGGGSFNRQMNEFENDFWNDVRPYVESHYRVRQGRAARAIAGLSMGGAQTLNVAIPHLEDFAYFGVYSSGVFGITGGFGGGGAGFEEQHAAKLDDASLKEGLELVWFATGKDDFLIETSRATVEMLKKHDFDVEYHETDGGHTWLNWRDYLADFAPRLFQEE